MKSRHQRNGNLRGCVQLAGWLGLSITREALILSNYFNIKSVNSFTAS